MNDLKTFNKLKYGHFTSKIFTDDNEVKRILDLPKSIRKKFCEIIIKEYTTKNNKDSSMKCIHACNNLIDGLITSDQYRNICNKYWMQTAGDLSPAVTVEVSAAATAVAITTSASRVVRVATTSQYYQLYFSKHANRFNQIVYEYKP